MLKRGEAMFLSITSSSVCTSDTGSFRSTDQIAARTDRISCVGRHLAADDERQ